MEHSMLPVEREAERQGWTVIGLVKARYSRGTNPNGVVAFVRHYPVFEDLRCGTAQYAINPNGEAFFFSGHYDLKRDDAIADLADRAAMVAA